MTAEVVGVDHVQLAIPEGGEEVARRFYRDILGFQEVPKPEALAARGGCWFERGAVALHLGVDPEFRPARKAHPALLVSDIRAFSERIGAAGFPVRDDQPIEGYKRIFTEDPFGNRIELMQKL